MGVYYEIVNPAKRQYLCASRFGESIKRGSLLTGRHAAAVALLVCRSVGHPTGPGWAGAWHGDPILIAGDCDPPDQDGIVTATPHNPERNLYALAWQEYQDISYHALALLCDWSSSIASELAEESRRHLETESSDFLRTELLFHLGNAVSRADCWALKEALDQYLGPDWLRRFEDSRRYHRDEDE